MFQDKDVADATMEPEDVAPLRIPAMKVKATAMDPEMEEVMMDTLAAKENLSAEATTV